MTAVCLALTSTADRNTADDSAVEELVPENNVATPIVTKCCDYKNICNLT